jgi:hypothetical protein
MSKLQVQLHDYEVIAVLNAVIELVVKLQGKDCGV